LSLSIAWELYAVARISPAAQFVEEQEPTRRSPECPSSREAAATTFCPARRRLEHGLYPLALELTQEMAKALAVGRPDPASARPSNYPTHAR